MEKSRFRWWVAFLFFLVYTIAAADRANLGVVLPFIRKEFAMTNTEAGGLASLFLIAYGLIQLPSAWLISKFGVRKVFPISMILTSLATAMTGMGNSLLALKASRVLLGIFEGPLPIGVTTTINNWFPTREKGTASGIFLSAVKFGPVITPIIGTLIVSLWGWRTLFIVFAIPGLLLSVVWYFLVKDNPTDSKFVSKNELDYIRESKTSDKITAITDYQSTTIPWLDKIIRTRNIPMLTTTKSVMTSWNVLGCSLGYSMQLGISSILLAWIPTYLLNEKKLSIVGMGFVASAPWIGAVIGNILGGYISDNLLGKRRKPGMLISALFTAIMMYALILTPNDPTVLGLLLLLTGIMLSIGYSAYMVYPMNFTSKEKYPTANAIVNMGGQLGGAATPVVAGYLLDNYGWNHVFTFMAIISVVTFIIVMTIVEPLDVRRRASD